MNNKQKLKLCLHENEFIVPSYTHYGGLSGFHDYGLLGTCVKNKFLDQWRSFFLHEDDILELECPTIMPYTILQASGHVERFTDYTVTDGDNNVFRADHIVKDYFKISKPEIVDQIEGWDEYQLEEAINEFNIIKPSLTEEGQEIDVKVTKSNLMYSVPSAHGEYNYFLRPELAQGIFVNFSRVQKFLGQEPPFGIAQIGKSYRKEISPTPFTRMREFSQAEIEYFVDPKDKSHPKYNSIKDYEIPILTTKMQLDNESVKVIKIGEAVDKGLISHQTMGYYLARIHMFAKIIGLNQDRIRFRQHLPNEMAHYASECWDLETFVNNDWLECVGCADRGDYDLKAHSHNSSFKLKKKLKEPIIEKEAYFMLNKKLIAKTYKELTCVIICYIENLDDDELDKILKKLQDGEKEIYLNIEDVESIPSNMFELRERVTKITFEEYYPHTIEPSFGIDRLLYSVFEHNFWVRPNDENRVVLSLPYDLIPHNIAIFPLHKKPDMINLVDKIKDELKSNKFNCYLDQSNVSIGKRYVRLDEIGVKYAITVDPGSLKDNMVTIRDRDSTKQIRVNIDTLVDTLNDLISNKKVIS